MNHYIREIMVRAGYAAPELAGRARVLADLIVSRCAQIAGGSIIMDKGYVPQDPHSKGWNACSAYISRELKVRFGESHEDEH